MVEPARARAVKQRAPISAQITEEDLKRHSQELGWFGTIFGSRQQAAVIFAGAIAILSIIGMIIVGTFAPSGADKSDLLKAFGAAVVAVLTFLGGIAGSNQK